MSELRKSGIDVLGDIPWGSHFCNFYETKQDLLDMLVPYFKTGLENKEFCLWILSNSGLISVKEAKEALKHVVPDLEQHLSKGDIEIFNETDWYLQDNVFNFEKVLDGWHAKLNQALALGYDGLRLAGDTFWLNEKMWIDFVDYEKQVNDSITDLPMTLLCTYSLTKSGAAQILDVAHNHQFAIVRRKGEWEMIETYMQIQAQAEIKRLNQTLRKAKIQTTMPSEISRYLVALLSVTFALIIAQFLDVHLVTAPVSLFFCAIMFSAWYGGIKPGLLSAALSLLAFIFFFVVPLYSLSFDLREMPRLIIFALSALFVVLLSAAQRNVTESLRRARNVLDGTVQKLMQTNTVLQAEIAERKKSELLIIREKELSNEIIDSIPGVFMLLDENFRIVRWNKNVELVSGYTAKEIPLLHAINDFYDDADERKKVQSLMEEAFEKGTIHAEVSPQPKDGRRISFYFNARLINYEGKSCVICTAIDITERKRAEDELRLAYQRLTYHFENTPLAVIEFDKDLFIKRWSKRAEEIFGWKASEALGKNVYDPDFPIIYKEDMPVVDEINEELIKGMVNRNLSLNRNYTKDGNIIYCEWYNSVLRDEQGNVITILSLVHNVTEKKIAEEQIKKSEAHLTEAQRMAKLGSWDYDIEADRLTWSDELYNVFGTDKRTFRETHSSFLHLIDQKDRKVALQTSKHTQQTGEPFTIEYHITTPNGEKRVIQEHGYGQIDDTGKVVRLFGTAQDITERKKAEETLRQSYEEIRRLTDHLQKIREEERTHIAREIHDELGQQLTVLKMEVKGLNKKLRDAEEGVKEKIGDILELLDTTVKSVRRISSELRPNLLHNLGLAAAIDWHLKEFEKRSGIETSFNEPREEPALSDSTKNGLFRIFQESLTNVSRHANANKVKVGLEQKGQQLFLSIEDNGQGFEKEGIAAKDTLGILGMKERSQMMGGNYEIISIPGKGTTVIIAVPYNGENNLI
jgi:PAS domain S-box-containing protein